MPVPDSNTTPRGMLIPEIDDVDPVLTPAEQTQLDDRRRLLDTASIGYQRKWDDGTIMELGRDPPVQPRENGKRCSTQ